jgi:predicted aconitase
VADNKELFWLAGILEGEGCFSNRSDRYCSPNIQLVMTDMDVVIRAAKAMGSHKVIEIGKPTVSGKRLYRTNVYGSTALDLMKALFPIMGQRRSVKIAEILEVSASGPKSPYPVRRSYSRGAKICWSNLQ